MSLTIKTCLRPACVTGGWHLRVEYLGWRYTFDDVLLPDAWRTLCLAYLPHNESAVVEPLRHVGQDARQVIVRESVGKISLTLMCVGGQEVVK